MGRCVLCLGSSIGFHTVGRILPGSHDSDPTTWIPRLGSHLGRRLRNRWRCARRASSWLRWRRRRRRGLWLWGWRRVAWVDTRARGAGWEARHLPTLGFPIRFPIRVPKGSCSSGESESHGESQGGSRLDSSCGQPPIRFQLRTAPHSVPAVDSPPFGSSWRGAQVWFQLARHR